MAKLIEIGDKPKINENAVVLVLTGEEAVDLESALALLERLDETEMLRGKDAQDANQSLASRDAITEELTSWVMNNFPY